MLIGIKMRRIASVALAGAIVLGGATIAASPASAAGKCTAHTYGVGYNRTDTRCIKNIQKLVNGWRNYPPVAVDGLWGNETIGAIRYFQNNTPYGLTKDGIVGPATWRALCTVNGNTAVTRDSGC